MIPHISVSAHALNGYASHALAGLHELVAGGEVSMDYRLQPPSQLLKERTGASVVRMNVTGNGERTVNVAIDLTDTTELHPDLISDIDILIKRSFSRAGYDNHPLHIVPYGLQFACSSPNEPLLSRAEHAWRRRQMPERHRKHTWANTAALFTQPYYLHQLSRGRHSPANPLPFLIQDFEVDPDAASRPGVFYRTRVYSRKAGAQVNEFRVAVIRALRNHFGDRFQGGLRRTPYAEQHYPDCIYEHDLDWRGHLQVMQASEVCVTTSGLHNSIDWKVAEYMAASRSMVAQTFRSSLPAELEHGKHALFFDGADSCVEACAAILDNPELSRRLRHNAHAYFREWITPAAAMRRCISIALDYTPA